MSLGLAKPANKTATKLQQAKLLIHLQPVDLPVRLVPLVPVGVDVELLPAHMRQFVSYGLKTQNVVKFSSKVIIAPTLKTLCP